MGDALADFGALLASGYVDAEITAAAYMMG